MPNVKTSSEWPHSTLKRAGRLGALAAVSIVFSGCGLLITPQHRIAVARTEMKAGRWQAAAGELRTVVQGHPGNAEAWKLLAEVSFGAGDISGAQSSLQHALAAGAKGPEVDALRLRFWLAAGQPKKVIAAVAGHTVHPGEPARSLDLARAYLATGQADRALAVLQPLLAQRADLTRGRVVMAEALAAQGKLQQALQQLDAAMRGDTKSPYPPLLEGRILASRGQYAAAEQALDVALKRMPPAQPVLERAGALIVLAEAQLAQGKTDAAAKTQAVLAAQVPGAPVVEMLAGRIELARGHLSAGVNRLEDVVAKAPGFIEARLYLGAAELDQGNLQQAQQQLEQVVQAQPDNLPARKLLATVRLRLGEPAGALSVLTPALESPSQSTVDPQLLYLLAAAGGAPGSEPAVQKLERKLRADSKSQAAVLNLARLQAATGNLTGARDTLSAALAAHPDALPVRLTLAGVLLRSKAFPQALAVLQAADKPGAGPGIKLAVARVQLAQGNLEAAQGTLDQAIAAQPNRAPLIESAGALLFEANQYGAALQRFAQATALEPGNALYWLNSARAQLALHQTAAARESLLKAARIRPNWLPVVGILAFLDVHAGNRQAALARVNALVAGHRNDAPALALKGSVEAALGDTGAAIAAYTQAQALDPTAQIAVQLYRLQLASHRADAEKPLEDWLAREPGDWRVREILGEYDLAIHALRPAAQQFETTVQQSPDDVIALNNLAWIYGKLEDPRAVAMAERVYKLAPQVPQVDDTVGWILARRNEAARAVPLLARAAKLIPSDPDVAYHYAYALSKSGKPYKAREVLTGILSTSRSFDSRAAAQRLLASLPGHGHA